IHDFVSVYSTCDLRLLPPFPTRRSSDLDLLEGGSCEFRVWAPERDRMNLHLVHPMDRTVPMTKNGQGYFEVTVDQSPGPIRYFLDRKSTRLNSSHVKISYAVFCLKKKNG